MRTAFFQRIFAHYQGGLVRALAGRPECQVDFFGAVADPLGSGIEPIGADLRAQIRFHQCRTVHFGPRVAFQWRAVWEALAGSFDVIILEGGANIITNWLAIPLARLTRKRVLLNTHGWLREERGAKGFVRTTFYRMADALLLYGHRARSIGIALGFRPDMLYVVHNALDIDESTVRLTPSADTRAEFREQVFKELAARPILVSVGRLTWAKRYDLLLDAAAALAGRGMPVNVLLVGDGPERPALESRAAELGISVVCTGSRYDESFLADCFGAAEMTVIPGAAGLTVIHSLIYGTPVVTHGDGDEQMPEYEAIEDRVTGALFRRGDAADLAKAIAWVLQDLPKTPQVIHRCRAVIARAYTPERMASTFVDAIVGLPAS